jgi:DNA-dependent RNA polymerase auxiliary subunit epsilon
MATMVVVRAGRWVVVYLKVHPRRRLARVYRRRNRHLLFWNTNSSSELRQLLQQSALDDKYISTIDGLVNLCMFANSSVIGRKAGYEPTRETRVQSKTTNY